MVDKSYLRRLFSSQPEKYYNVQVLKEYGFTRKKCPKCGNYFWSVEKNTCGDTECEGGYNFIGKNNFGWDLLTGIQRWEKFFEKHYHKVVDPYPVAARWRDDLFFVIASIADFQPWVVKGIAEPPGNPLVVAQPCIRFNDIANIGKSGRHLSLFFMGGQHAFNLPSYWIDTTLELGLKFLTEELKIPIEAITYREDVWAGGGNFGPSFEAFVGGLEIVNHVFMQFEELPDGSFREMDRKVVDTGWGLERVVWFARGAYNVYEAIFPMLPKLRNELVDVDMDKYLDFWNKAGLIDFSERSTVPEDVKKYLKELQPLMDLYAILDHTRTLTFALVDGIIPSNVGGGYNLRVILRRTFALIERNKFDIDIAELIKDHARYFSKRIKRMKELPDVEDIIKVEYERMIKSREMGRKMVEKYVKQGIIESKLVELYESHGLAPEVVKEIAKELGKEIEIPTNFYEQIKKERKSRLAKKMIHIRDLPETKPIYYEHDIEKPFFAKVIYVEGNEVILDKTAFYPTKGGQEHDTGILEWEGNVSKVIDVKAEGKAIIHVLEGPVPKLNTLVKGLVDKERRYALMRHHTAVHVVNGAARKVLGNHIWQAGAEKTVDKARLDITHYKPISKEELREIERVANEIVLKNIRVKKMEMERSQAEQKYGFRIYQGGVVPGKKLRIVEIGNFDVEACGGTHVDNTGEIGLIKILGSKRIQDGVVRLELVAGLKSLEYLNNLEDKLNTISEKLKVPVKDVERAIDKVIERAKKGITAEGKIEGNKVLVGYFTGEFRAMEKELSKEIKKRNANLAIGILDNGGILVISNSDISALEIARKIAEAAGGNAGGNEKLARGGGRDAKKALELAKKIAKNFE